MKIKELIAQLQTFSGELEVECMWDRQVRDGWQEMSRSIEGVEIRGVTGAGVLCKVPKSDAQDPIFKVSDKVIIL